MVTTRLDGKIIEDRAATYASHLNPIDGFVGVRTGLGEDATVHDVKVVAKTGQILLGTDFAEGNPFGVGEIKSAGLKARGPSRRRVAPNDRAMPLLRTAFASGKTLTRRGSMPRHGRLPAEPQRSAGRRPAPRARVHRLRQAHPVPDLRRDRPGRRGRQRGRRRAGRRLVGRQDRPGWRPGKFGTTLVADRPAADRLHRRQPARWVDTDDSLDEPRPARTPPPTTSTVRPTTPRLEQPGLGPSRLRRQRLDRRRRGSGGHQRRLVAAARRAGPDHATLLGPAPDRTRRWCKYVYDLGQNMVGVARMALTARPARPSKIRYAEVLNPDGTLYTGQPPGSAR